MAQRVTIGEIAKRCGVSPATVSLVLNNKPGISEATRIEIIETARGMGYPLQPASSLQAGHLRTLGMLVKSEPGLLPPANPFYSKIINGVDMACQDLGINLLFSMLPVDENNRPVKLPPLLEGNMADGLLMVGAFIDETISSVLRARHVPVVLVDGYSDTERFDMVVSDNFRAAYQAVEHLIGQGHRHIGLAGGAPDCYPSLCERRNGYFRALKENGIPDTYVANCNVTRSHGEEEITRLLTETPHISAVFAVNDDVALGAVRAAQRLGLRVPEDISVVGYDDTDLALRASPALTTMHVDTVAMGQGAVQLMSLRLRQPDAARITLVVHPTLVQRSTTAVPRSDL
jgi:DNA-binding LacI/PurR family transcriptional regulator